VTQTEDNIRLTERLLEAVTSQDLEGLSSLFHDDAEYTDISTPEDDVARGGAEVAARLGLALEGVELTNKSRNIVANDFVVMVERIERWTWRTGEVLDLPIATVIEVSGPLISRWIDYWDMQTFLAVAPGWWLEHVMQGWKA
jgi:limonene-1,2-epoxide hydrolase